jgi:hypothetical protein
MPEMLLKAVAVPPSRIDKFVPYQEAEIRVVLRERTLYRCVLHPL